MFSFVLRAFKYAVATMLVLGVSMGVLITGGLPKAYEMTEVKRELGDLYVRALAKIEREARSLRKDYCRDHEEDTADQPGCAPASS